MKRNSTTIWVESESSNPSKPCITHLPWLGNEPDFAGIEERTLSILRNAWEAGRGEIQIVPDFTPIPEVIQPDWEAFMREMDRQGLFMVGLTANFAVFTQIFNMLLALRDKQALANDDSIEWRNFKLMYGLGRAAFSSGQLAQIEAAMILANIPLID